MEFPYSSHLVKTSGPFFSLLMSYHHQFGEYLIRIIIIIVCYCMYIRFSKKYTLLCGIWFGRDKPVMTTFLKPIVEQLNTHYKEGKLFLLVSTVFPQNFAAL